MDAKGILTGLTLAIAGCTRDQPPPPAPPAPTSLSPAAASPPPAAPPVAGEESVEGTVIETMSSAGYTYAKLDDGHRQVWVAGPETTIAVGAKVAKVSGTAMPGFRSTTLNRTFDLIYFVNVLTVTGGAMPNPHGAAPTAPATPLGKIEPAAGGTTIAQLFATKDSLAGKSVVVRGKIVKVNNGILGKNWLHLQDGTGAGGTNDLIVTTDATVAKDDVVVVRGTVTTNKDFGAGYKYAVLVENATVTSK